jgi:hypothetical protein
MKAVQLRRPRNLSACLDDAVSYQVLIRRNADGIERLRTIDLDWGQFDGEGDGDLFWWTEGNMGCDGNRETEFERAAGNEREGEHVCSEGKYTVVKAILPDGREIPIDRAEEYD